MASRETPLRANEVAALITRLVAFGISGQVLATIIRANRTRGAITEDLRTLVKSLPRKEGHS